jgi:hypothetical protein
MRGTGALFATLGAVAAVGFFAGSGRPAAAATIAFPPPGGSSQGTRGIAAAKDLETALLSLAAGAQTLGGPGNFSEGVGQGTLVYEVLTGTAPDVCITVRNLSAGKIDLVATGATTTEVGVGRTRTACYGAPSQISLRCDQRACAGVWRVDRQ